MSCVSSVCGCHVENGVLTSSAHVVISPLGKKYIVLNTVYVGLFIQHRGYLQENCEGGD